MMKLAVIGKPIRHSLSPIIHTEFAKEFGLNISYEAIEVDPDSFETTVRKMFKDEGYSGLNVTLPLKQLAFKFADACDIQCKLTESANTLTRGDIDEGFTKLPSEYVAFTTDGEGFTDDIRKKGFGSLFSGTIVIIGAGGSAKSIIPSILEDNPFRLVVVNRTFENAKKLKDKFSEIEYLSPKGTLDFEADIVINCSSAGMLNEPLVLPEGLFKGSPISYDLSYSKEITPFNKLAKDSGVEISFDGLGMLVNQAAISFKIWTGEQPSTNRVLNLLKRAGYKKGNWV